MRVTVEQIDQAREEELILRCHDPGAAWVERLTAAASGQRTVCGWNCLAWEMKWGPSDYPIGGNS